MFALCAMVKLGRSIRERTRKALNEQQDLQVTYVAVNAIHPSPTNVRTHPKRQVEQIAASISTFGFTNPILVDPELNILAGHGRLLGAKKLGLARVPTITLRGLNEAQQRALRIADNKIALNAGWDTDLLRIELQALVISEVDVGALGFVA